MIFSFKSGPIKLKPDMSVLIELEMMNYRRHMIKFEKEKQTENSGYKVYPLSELTDDKLNH